MQPKINETCMFLMIAKDIWEIIRQIYFKVRDATHIYEIKTKISVTKQGTFSVTE